MKKLLSLLCLALVSVAHASPAILASDAKGVTANADLIRHYSSLCERFPQFGDKAGDGVFILDADKFHLDSKHYADYLKMCQLEQVYQSLKQTSLNESFGRTTLGG
jgi:hypothetical protein